MWVEPQLLLAQRARPGPAGDFGDLVPLTLAARAVLPSDQVVADGGYDGEANHRFCREELGVDSPTPAKKRRSAKIIATTPYRQEMHRLLRAPGDEASRGTYRQRWKAETVMSVVKRGWGEALSARLDATQHARRCSAASSATSTASSSSAPQREASDIARYGNQAGRRRAVCGVVAVPALML